MTPSIRPRPAPFGLLDRIVGSRREVVSFAIIGAASTLAYALIYLALRAIMPAAWANVLGLVVTALGNTAANRRITFGIRERRNLGRDHIAGLVALAVALVLSSGALALLASVAPSAPHRVELAVLLASQVGATVLRFLILRTWLRRPQASRVTTRA